MNKLVFSAFIAFWSSVITLLAVSSLAGETSAPRDDALPVYTLSDVAEHDREESCWMAIEDRVYDLTGYLPKHPTPLAVMLEWCGREATEGMRTKGYGRDHSQMAWEMLDDYLIGKLAGADAE